MSLNNSPSDIFVGREEELRTLKGGLIAAEEGAGHFMVLSGEPGIGKTRTANEIAAVALERDFLVVHGRCHEGEGSPAYWPWIQVIRFLLHDYEPEHLETLLESGGPVIAEIDSHIRRHLSHPSPAPAIEDPVSARFRLFDSVTTFLINIADDKSMLIILDDLHWADRSSLLLLEFFVHHGLPARVLLLGTYREVDLDRRHALRDLLGDLARERSFDRIFIHGLDISDIDSYIRMFTNTEPADDLLSEIYRLTQGNPLFVQEVVRLLADAGECEGGAQDTIQIVRRIPDGIREAIGRRFNRLPEKCNEVLILAAVVGMEFSINVVARLHDFHVGTLELLEPAFAAGIIEDSDESGRYRFNHVLTQMTLVEELTTTRRIRLHAAVAEALVAEYADTSDEHATEIVEHYYQAESVSDPRIVARYLAAAGKKALAIYAHEDAASFFERALAIADGNLGGAPTAELHQGVSRAYTAMRDNRARYHMRLAFEWYEENGHAEKAADMAGSPGVFNCGSEPLDLDLFERALQLVPRESKSRAGVLANLAFQRCVQTGEIDRAEVEFDEAAAFAVRTRDVALQMRIEADRSFVDALRFDNDKQIERSRKVMEFAKICSDPIAESRAASTAALACLRIGSTDEGLEHCRRCLRIAERLGDRFLISYGSFLSAMFASELAQWDEARDFWNRHEEVSDLGPAVMARRAQVEAEEGDDETARSELLRLIQDEKSGYLSPYVATLLIRSNSQLLLEPAKMQLRAAEEHVGPDLIDAIGRRHRIANSAIMIAYFEDDQASADKLSSELKLYHWFPGPSFTIERPLGFLDLTRGEWTEAIKHFDLSIAICHDSRFVVFEGWDRRCRNGDS